MNQYITKRNIFLFIIIIGTFTLLIVPFTRLLYFNALLVGEESYYHARIANYFIERGIPAIDEAIDGGRPYVFEPYHLLLSRIGYFIGVELTSQLLPFISGVFSLIIFYLILLRLRLNLEQIFYSMVVLILSPPFIGAFTFSNPEALSIACSLIAIYLFMKEDVFYFSLAVCFMILSALFTFIAPFIALVSLLAYAIYQKRLMRHYLLLTTILGMFVIIYSSALYWIYGLPAGFSASPGHFFQRFLSDLGAQSGFSIFSIILCGIGIAFTWHHKRKLLTIYLCILTLFILTLFSDLPNLYLNFYVATFAGIAIHYLIKREWTLYLIKELTILAIFCGLIFSTTSYMARIATTEPSKEVVDSLVWLDINSKRNELVLSHPSKGFWIEYLAERRVILDDDLRYVSQAPEKLEAVDTIFSSRNLRETTQLLDSYNVTYIWIDPEMRDGLVWNRPNEGLLYLLSNNQTFRNIYYENGIGIWRYLG